MTSSVFDLGGERNKSPVWDYESSPKVEVSKSQLDRLAQDETYFELFVDWLNNRLQKGATTDKTTGKIIHLDDTIQNLQPRTDNLISRVVGDSIYDRVSQWFSTQESNFIHVQVSDEETVKKVEWLRENVVPVLSHLLNGNLERYTLTKRLEEARKEVDDKIPNKGATEEENRQVKDILKLIEKHDVDGKEVGMKEWSERFSEVKVYKKKTSKAVALIRAFEIRFLRRVEINRIVAAVEDKIAGNSDPTRDVSDMIKTLDEKFKTGEFKESDASDHATFTCDTKSRFSLSCSDDDGYYDIPKILDNIGKILLNTNVSSKEVRNNLLSLLVEKLRKYADDKTIIYENLLDLFESSKEKEFAQKLKEDYIPKIQDLFAYSSFLVNNWQPFVEMIYMIRLKLESINPSAIQLSLDTVSGATTQLQTMRDLRTLRNEEMKSYELEKRCSFNRLAAVFSDIDNTIGATSLGGTLPERLRGIYFRLWGSLQQVVKNDEVDVRILCKTTSDALNKLVGEIESATNNMNHLSDSADKLENLTRTWDEISSAINKYLNVVKDDHQTLPVLLDNQVFLIDKANLLLPQPSGDAQDIISRLTFKIYYMQLFFKSLCESVVSTKKDLRVVKTDRDDRSVAKRTTQRLIDEIQYRERYINGSFNTNASYAAAFRIICDTILRHITWYFCVGSINDQGVAGNRYKIDFRIYEPHGTSDKLAEFERIPDIGNYILYMKQFIDENNRTRKTSTFKIDFFRMVYTQFLSNFHSIETGSGGKVQFLARLFVIDPTIEKAANLLIKDSNALAFEEIRASSPYKQLVLQYSYDDLVRSWSVEALSETEFLLLMDHAKEFYGVVQVFYDALFDRNNGTTFQNTTKSSLLDSLVVSNLVSVVRSLTPDWHTIEMCETLVNKILLDTSGRTIEKRDFVGDAKKFIKNIARAGGSRDGDLMTEQYVCEALKNIARWVDNGGILDGAYLKHFQLMFAKVRQEGSHLINWMLGTGNEGVLPEVRGDVLDGLKLRLGSKPSPKNYLSVVSDVLIKEYKIAPDFVRQRIDSSDLDTDDEAVKAISMFKAL